MAMPRALKAILAIALLIAVGESTRAADSPPTIEEAQRRLAAGKPASAVELLESALFTATNETRPIILRHLEIAYREAIKQAEAAGDLSAAVAYREHLAILEKKPIIQKVDSSNELMPRGTDEAALGDPSIAPPEPPRSLENTPSVESVLSPVEVERHQDDEAVPDIAPSASGEAQESLTRPAKPMAEIAQADSAFLARRYREAGQIYGDLAKASALPEIRHDPWAYCRMTEVVQRINAGPRSTQEWAWIRQEILEIRRLSPRNWYAEYLRNLADELSARGRRADSGTMVLRGASPSALGEPPVEAPIAKSGSRTASTSASETGPSQSRQELGNMVGRPGESIEGWQSFETTNFRVLHHDQALAREVAVIAERVRGEQLGRWSAAAGSAPWTPRCDIYLYPSAEDFARRTGQPAESPGFSTMALNTGRVTVRRINLRADHENLRMAILPHEITHVVLADLFPTTQIPRWADEGIAVLAEPESEQALRAADLTEPLKSGRLFRLADLMKMDYPEAEHWSLYYAQSVSLTRLLIELGSEQKFIEFIKTLQSSDAETALNRHYGIANFEDLELRWHQHAQANSTEIAANRNVQADRLADIDTDSIRR